METRLHHIEIFVRDAPAVLARYRGGFALPAIRLPHHPRGLTDCSSHALQVGSTRMIVTAPEPGRPSAVAGWLERHGEGVAHIALTTGSTGPSGGRPDPCDSGSAHGPLAGPGSLGHSLWPCRSTAPGPDPGTGPGRGPSPGEPGHGAARWIEGIDHLTLVVEPGSLGGWVEHYRRTLGLESCFHFAYAHPEAGMTSQVMGNRAGDLVLVLVEPRGEGRRSQLWDFLRRHPGGGVQHLALRSGHLLESAAVLAGQGLAPVPIPAPYYELLECRHGRSTLPHPLDQLRRHGVVAELRPVGWLLQAFYESLHGDSAFFLELIERRGGGPGFGEGNIAMLFEARERVAAP